MFFIDGNRMQIIASVAVDPFRLVEKDDAVLVIASYGMDTTPITLGRYQTTEEARDSLYDLLDALVNDEAGYEMKASSGKKLPLEAPLDRYHGIKQKRRGGS